MSCVIPDNWHFLKYVTGYLNLSDTRNLSLVSKELLEIVTSAASILQKDENLFGKHTSVKLDGSLLSLLRLKLKIDISAKHGSHILGILHKHNCPHYSLRALTDAEQITTIIESTKNSKLPEANALALCIPLDLLESKLTSKQLGQALVGQHVHPVHPEEITLEGKFYRSIHPFQRLELFQAAAGHPQITNVSAEGGDGLGSALATA